MDPTQAHSAGSSLTVRLDSREVDSVVQDVAEATLVEHLGSPLRIETSPGSLRILGPGSSGVVSLTILPRSGGLTSARLEGGIEGWESLSQELRERFLRAAARRTVPVPADGYCHALGFGRECDRRLGHSGNHLNVRGIPASWTPDGTTLVPFESRFVVEDLLDRIHTLESMVDRARTAASSATVPRRSRGEVRSVPAGPSLPLRPPPPNRPKLGPRGARASHRRKAGGRAAR